jgi:hypothetical protein
MRDLSKRTKVLAAVSAVAVVAAGGGIALAYWTGSGTGHGTASTGTSTNFTVTTAAATGGPLTPGGATETVGYTVKNTSTGSEKLTSVAISVANNDGTAWTAVSGCSAADYNIDSAGAGLAATDTSAAGDIAGGASATGSITVQMVDTASNQNNCQGVSVPLYLVAS